MRVFSPLVLFVCLLLPLLNAFPLCTDQRVPVILNETLKFCSKGGGGDASCCDGAVDVALRMQFEAMGVKPEGGECAGLVKSILCAKCNPFSAELFNIGSTARAVPFLCKASAGSSAQSKDPSHPTEDYCKQIWKYCKKTPIWNSPFQSSVQENAGLTSSSSMLTDLWQSEKEFCASFSGTPDDQSVCFNGHGVSFNTRQPSTSPRWMCLEKIGNGSYNNMAPHPDGFNKIFLSSQDGKIWLVTVPVQGMGGSLQLDGTSLFLDLTNEDYLNSEPGLVGIAFHPEFENNGRYFVSYICDRTKSPSCAGKCSCDCNAGCDPTKLRSDDGIEPCQYQLVVSEYSANDSSSDNSEGTYAGPSEVRRIFTMGLPYASNHGGQILFGPTDGYLYLVTSNGGKKGDSFNFSLKKNSLLGKILRLDIDELPRLSNSTYQNLWGNYSVPNDNPYAKDSNLQPEIWALGLGKPSRCSFDSKKPFYFFCADNGEYEVLDLISKGGNYGPGAYEDLHVSEDITSASIIGGYVYRGSVDPGLYGRYLYFDVYASAMGMGTEIPPSSGKYTFTTIPFNCSKKTPIPCDDSAISPLGEISSFGEDKNKDIFLLASKGVYRVVQPSFCAMEPMPNPATYNGTTISNNRKPSKWTLPLKIVVPVLALVAGLLGAAAWSCYCRCFGNNISCFSCFNRGNAIVEINNNEVGTEDPALNLPDQSPPKLSDIELTGVICN